MKKSIIFLLSLTMLLACKKEHSITTPPVISYNSESYVLDYNKSNRITVSGTITAESDLRSVEFYRFEDGKKVVHKTITSFADSRSYTFEETIGASAQFRGLIIEALDSNGGKTEHVVNMKIVHIADAPTIAFESDVFVFDDINPSNRKNLIFSVESEGGLQKLELTAIKADQSERETIPLEFSDFPNNYKHDVFVEFEASDVSLQVVAIDQYGQITTAQLRVAAASVSPPAIAFEADVFEANIGEVLLPHRIESVVGLQMVEYYGLDKSGQEFLLKTVHYAGELNVELSESIVVAGNLTGIRVKAKDMNDTEGSSDIKAAIGYRLLERFELGSQQFGNPQGPATAISALFSVKDLRSYFVNDLIDKAENNADIIFFIFGSALVPRLAAIDTESNASTYHNGGDPQRSISEFAVKNATRYLKLNNFDFDNAIASDIQAISPESITNIQGQNLAVGDVVAFKTGETSAAGAGKVGVLKVLDVRKLVPDEQNNRSVLTFALKVLR